MMRARVADRGSILVLVVLVGLAITGATTIALVPVLADLIDHQRAQSAADAVALAGVNGGRSSSNTFAAANDAELVGWRRDGRTVTVEVRVGDQTAIARATDEP